MSFESFWPTVEDTVGNLSRGYGRKGHAFGVDADDFQQEFIAWLLDNENRVDVWLASEGEDATMRLVGKSLHNLASDLLGDARAQSGVAPRERSYQRSSMKELLQLVYTHDDLRGDPADWIAVTTDVEAAMGELSPDDRTLLTLAYEDGWPLHMLAGRLGVARSTVYKRHERALDRLHSAIVGTPAPDPWKGRRATSNAGARAYQQNVYDED